MAHDPEQVPPAPVSPRDASDRTLGLISIWQVLRKLCWEIELLNAIPKQIPLGARPQNILHVQDARLYAAINAASTNIALVDWLYHSIRDDRDLIERAEVVLAGIQIDSDTNFMRSLREISKIVNACHQICSANKHFHLRRPQQDFKIMVGEIVLEQSDGTAQLATVAHVVQNGAGQDGRGSVDAMLADSAIWWEDVLSRIGFPGRDLHFPALQV